MTHAAGSPDTEVCGLLFGESSRIIRALPAANIAENPKNSFEIDPTALFAANRTERGGGERLVGHYHSHPVGPAHPSARDHEMAWEAGRLWLIVAAGKMGLWRAQSPGRLETVELALASPPLNRH